MSKRLTMLEILEETLAYYSENPDKTRGLCKNGDCAYNSENGSHCAVGRCLLTKYQKQGTKLKFNLETVWAIENTVGFDSLDEVLKTKYRGHSLNFWQHLQGFHDNSEFWGKKTLKKRGQKEFNEIKKAIINGEFDNQAY